MGGVHRGPVSRLLVTVLALAVAGAPLFLGTLGAGAAGETGVPQPVPGEPDAAGHLIADPLELPCLSPAEFIPVVGPACPVADGLLKVRFQDGTYGYTHGAHAPDASHSGSGTSPYAARNPACVGDVTREFHTQVVYARAMDQPDRYSSQVSTIRDSVRQANGHVNGEAQRAAGVPADLRVRCEGGLVHVANVVLPTPNAQHTFQTIVSDLRALGYTSPRVKVWVVYDGPNPSACGIGSGYRESTQRDPENPNNGGGSAVSVFAAVWPQSNCGGWKTMLHELGHSMGAVANAAPQSSGAGHCNDGHDVMCYSDGGPASAYSGSVCGSFYAFDCNFNTYFHPNPPAGSYLASNWQVGWNANRYLRFASDNTPPFPPTASCPRGPHATKQNVTCTIGGGSDSDSSGYHYVFDWSDGTRTRVPATGNAAPGATYTAAHAWSKRGTFTVNAHTVDDHPSAMPSLPATAPVDVVGNSAPRVTAFECLPLPANPTPHGQVTCRFRVDDDSAWVRYTIAWGDGVVSTTSGTYNPDSQLTWSRGMAPGSYTATLTATDTEGLTSAPAATPLRVNGPPAALAFSCTPVVPLPGEQATCSISATDDFFGVHYLLTWEDGSTTRLPSAGAVASGTVLTATRTWPQAGTYSLTALATDAADAVGLTPLSVSRALTVRVALPCDVTSTGRLTVGLLGFVDLVGTSAADVSIPPECATRAFTLTSQTAGGDFDVCWFSGTTSLRCDQAVGDEGGIVPDGADRARVRLWAGADARYTLRLGTAAETAGGA